MSFRTLADPEKCAQSGVLPDAGGRHSFQLFLGRKAATLIQAAGLIRLESEAFEHLLKDTFIHQLHLNCVSSPSTLDILPGDPWIANEPTITVSLI